MMASAIIGEMFKKYKKDRSRFAQELKVMACLTAVNKKSLSVTPVYNPRDRGGLYVIATDFLPALRSLDIAIREDLGSQKHGKKIVKVNFCTVLYHVYGIAKTRHHIEQVEFIYCCHCCHNTVIDKSKVQLLIAVAGCARKCFWV